MLCTLRMKGLWGLALAALALVVSGCGGDGDGAPGPGGDVSDGGGEPPAAQGGRGQECRPGGVCNNPLVCEAGTCVDAPDEEGALGGACRADGSCDAGLECVSEVCRAADAAEGELGGGCTPDGACDAGLECRAGVCRTAPVPPTEPAPPTEPPPGGTGERCERNADCPESVCLPLSDGRQVCTLRCTSDASCIPGWRCAPIGGIVGQVCQCDPQAERCNGEDNSCTGVVDVPLSGESPAQLDCSSGDVCVSGTCVEGAGMPPGFVGIPAGSFTMGSPEGEVGRSSNEDQASVTLTRSFLLQATPVTQGQWETLMGSNPSRFADCGSDCPVENVSWFEAAAYANALSASEGLAPCYDDDGVASGGATVYDCEGYRLPTEAEWEYAARAGTTTATYNGDLPGTSCEESLPVLDAIAWYSCNSDTAQPVRQKEPNAWGLYDMLGNVFEWTDTWYQAAHSDGVDPVGPSTGSARVIRGGSWGSLAYSVRAGARTLYDPGSRDNFLGFRLARTAP